MPKAPIGLVCAEGNKFCSKCNRVLPVEDFHVRKKSPDGRYVWCKTCSAAYASSWYERNRARVKETQAAYHEANKSQILQRHKDYHRQARYGLSVERFSEMVQEQDARCAICQTLFVEGVHLHVDHDHACCPGEKTCGQCVRSLLCSPCNRGLGGFRDDPFLLHVAAEYVICHKESNATAHAQDQD